MTFHCFGHLANACLVEMAGKAVEYATESAKEKMMGHEPSTLDRLKSAVFGEHHEETTTEKMTRKAGEAYENAKGTARGTRNSLLSLSQFSSLF